MGERMIPILIRLPSAMRAELVELVRLDGRSLSEFLRALVAQAIREATLTRFASDSSSSSSSSSSGYLTPLPFLKKR